MAATGAVIAAVRADSTSYAGYSRFELELEFVQSLSNPQYLNYLASKKYFDDPCFIAYLSYLRYFSQPQYARFLSYPGPTLKALELLQEEQFRRAVLSPAVVMQMIEEGLQASKQGFQQG